MVATPITATQRFIEPGTLRCYFVATIAVKTAPTRIELDAGSDLTAEVETVNGFSTTSNAVDAPDFGSRFTSQVSGKITAAASSLQIYRSTTSADVRSLLPRDTAGFIVLFPEGDTPGKKMDVFPVKVSTASKDHSDSNAATHTIEFVITSVPAENVTIP